MKRFRVEGQYRYNDEKAIKKQIIEHYSKSGSVELFEKMHNYYFYKITVEEIQ